MSNLREIASRCEAKLHGFRRTADGVVVSFVLHPAEVPPVLALDPLGTRYMLAFVAIADDEQPLAPSVLDASALGPDQPGCGRKTRRSWHMISPSERAAILCADAKFREWISDNFSLAILDAEDAADWLRDHLGIKSRSELTTNDAACRAYEAIDQAYRVQAGLEHEIR